MIRIYKHRTVPAPADQVWRDLRTFRGVERFLPPIHRSEVDGEGAGAVRVCTMHDGARLEERLERVDDDRRELEYTILNGPMPLENYRSTMQVLEQGPTSCQVVWACTFDALDAPEGELEQSMSDLYAAGLDGLAHMYADARTLDGA